jgi:hypothetical protein
MKMGEMIKEESTCGSRAVGVDAWFGHTYVFDVCALYCLRVLHYSSYCLTALFQSYFFKFTVSFLSQGNGYHNSYAPTP